MAKCKDVVAGPIRDQTAQLAVIFMDDNRGSVGSVCVQGFWHGTFDWEEKSEVLNVPAKAREAIVTIGLLGGTGEVSYDNVQIAATSNGK
jgi:hypothetical protein